MAGHGAHTNGETGRVACANRADNLLTNHETRLVTLEGIAAPKKLVFDIRDYGAKIDGTTDDTAAWVAADAAARAVAMPGVKGQTNIGQFQQGSQLNGAGIVYHPGGVSVISNLKIGHRVTVAGVGWGSLIRQKASSTGPVLQPQFDTSVHAKYVTIRDIAIDGNRANQASSTNHGIYLLSDQTFNYNSTLDEDWDANNSVENVYIWNCKGDGIRILGSGENRIHNVKIRSVDGVGMNVDYDNYITHCTIGHTGLQGMLVSGKSNRIVEVKCWYTGEITPASGQGFLLTADKGALTGCEAQDCTAAGVQVGTTADGAFNWSISALELDRNSKGSTGTYAQLKVQNGSNNNIECTVSNDYASSAPGTVALDIDAASQQNHIILNPGVALAGPAGWGVTTLLKSGSSTTGNSITFGASDGYQEVVYAATVTANPLLGQDIKVGTLTGAVTIANPTYTWPGMRLRYRLQQDGTGSRAVSFGAAFASGISVSTTANAVTVVDVVCSAAGVLERWN